MSLLPVDNQGLYRGLEGAEPPRWLEPEPPSGMDPREIEGLVAMANSGDPESVQKLIDLFGNEHSRHALLRYVSRRLAGAMGAGAYWDHYKFEAEFQDELSQIREDGDDFHDALLVEATSLAHAHFCFSQAGAYEIESSLKRGEKKYDRRDHRNQCRNFTDAVLAHSRTVRLLEYSRGRHIKREKAKVELENARLRGEKLQQEIRRLKEDRESRIENRESKSSKATGHEPFVPPPYDKPQAYGFETFEDYVAALAPQERARLLAELAYDDKHRGFWAEPEMFFYNRFPTLFPQEEQAAAEANPSDQSDSPSSDRFNPSDFPRAPDTRHPKPDPGMYDKTENHVETLPREPEKRDLRPMRSVTNILKELTEGPPPRRAKTRMARR